MRIDRIKLYEELFKRGIRQIDLAEMSGVSRATINGILAGRKCSDITGQKIADALQVDINDFIAQEVYK